MSGLADVILGNPDDTARIPQLRQGIVTATSPLSVLVGAATSSQRCRALASYVPTAGDTVSVLVIAGDRLVLGRADPSGGTGPVLSQFVLKTGDMMSGNLTMYDWLNIGTNAYGGFRGVNWGSNYLIMSNGTDTFVSTPTAGGTVYVRPGINNGGVQLALSNDGNHGLGGNISITGIVTSPGFNLTGNNSFYFATWGGGWYMTDGTWMRSAPTIRTCGSAAAGSQRNRSEHRGRRGDG